DSHTDQLEQRRDGEDRDIERQQDPHGARPPERYAKLDALLRLLWDRPGLAVDRLGPLLLPWAQIPVPAVPGRLEIVVLWLGLSHMVYDLRFTIRHMPIVNRKSKIG